MNRKAFLVLLFGLASLASGICRADDGSVIRVGVMAGGTLAWEIAEMKRMPPAGEPAFKLETVRLANPQAGKIALHADSVDVIVSDWIWVAAARGEGRDLTFYPFSSSAGGLIVPADSSIESLADLKGKRLGIAGGELDKNWLLLLTLARKQDVDLPGTVEKIYAAPPLLNQQLLSKRLDALLTFWQYAAKLQGQGYRQVFSGEDIIRELGISVSVPSLGYVFHSAWAVQNKAALQAFFAQAAQARDRLCSDDAAWRNIASLTDTADPAVQAELRKHYCAGRITQWGEANRQAAGEVYQMLREMDSGRMTGKQAQLPSGTFWPAD